MKKITILFLVFSGMLFKSCDDDITRPVVSIEQLPVIDNSLVGVYVLSSDTPTIFADTFSWTEAVYSEDVVPVYTIEVDLLENNFSAPQELGSTTANSLSVTSEVLNNASIDLGAVPAQENPIELRLRIDLGTLAPEYTEAITINVTPYDADVLFPLRQLYFVGNATASDWNNNNNNTPLFRDPDNEDIYYFRGYFVANEFKLLEVKGQWQPQWGTNDGTTLEVNDGTGADPGNFVIEATGYYDFEVDLSEQSFTLTLNEDEMVEYPTIGVIGNGTNPEDEDGDGTPDGWQSDIDLTPSEFDPHLWYINDITLFDGEIKLRADDDWAVNWGDNTALSGAASINGPNIPVTAGTYDLWFNDLDGRYILIPVE